MSLVHVNRLFPYKSIPFLYGTEVNQPVAQTLHDSIEAAKIEWQVQTGLHFMPFAEYFPKYVRAHGDHTPATIEFHFAIDPMQALKAMGPGKVFDIFTYRGNTSAVGIGKSGPIITASAHADVDTIVHEIGHAVGLYHEQCRPDRNAHVIVERILMPEGEYSQYEIELPPSAIPFGAYDVNSIMHYGQQMPYFFSKDPKIHIGRQKRTTPLGTTWLSQTDIDSIKHFYGSRDYL